MQSQQTMLRTVAFLAILFTVRGVQFAGLGFPDDSTRYDTLDEVEVRQEIKELDSRKDNLMEQQRKEQRALDDLRKSFPLLLRIGAESIETGFSANSWPQMVKSAIDQIVFDQQRDIADRGEQAVRQLEELHAANIDVIKMRLLRIGFMRKAAELTIEIRRQPQNEGERRAIEDQRDWRGRIDNQIANVNVSLFKATMKRAGLVSVAAESPRPRREIAAGVHDLLDDKIKERLWSMVLPERLWSTDLERTRLYDQLVEQFARFKEVMYKNRQLWAEFAEFEPTPLY